MKCWNLVYEEVTAHVCQKLYCNRPIPWLLGMFCHNFSFLFLFISGFLMGGCMWCIFIKNRCVEFWTCSCQESWLLIFIFFKKGNDSIEKMGITLYHCIPYWKPYKRYGSQQKHMHHYLSWCFKYSKSNKICLICLNFTSIFRASC